MIKQINLAVFIFSVILYCLKPVPGICSDKGLSTDTSAALSSIEKLAAAFDASIKGIETISFSFHQNTYLAGSTHTVKAEVFFKKPDMLKVKYTKPQKQEIYFFHGKLYTYIPSIKQATVQECTDFSSLLGVTVSMLFSPDSFEILKNKFELSIADNSAGMILEAVPHDRKDFNRMVIQFYEITYFPAKTVVTAEHIRSVTVFDNYVSNPQFNEDYFNFKPATDVNVIYID
ncbi:MAG: outer membrane lipoprotein carrier protein LolA [Elusimicrobiota bacterium]